MSRESLIDRANDVYFEQGLFGLIDRTKSFVLNKIYQNYAVAVGYMREHAPSELKKINLNQVGVSVEISMIDKYIPYYHPPYPTEDNPEYEYTEVQALRTHTRKDDDVVVIGGGLGVTTVVASRITEGSVTTFEQSPSTYEILKRTIDINECNNIDLKLAAVGYVNDSNLTYKIPSGVDTILPTELPHADIYEIDCEGAETMILENMEVRPSILLVETHNNHERVSNLIEEMGYDIINVISEGNNQDANCTHIRARFHK